MYHAGQGNEKGEICQNAQTEELEPIELMMSVLYYNDNNDDDDNNVGGTRVANDTKECHCVRNVYF